MSQLCHYRFDCRYKFVISFGVSIIGLSSVPVRFPVSPRSLDYVVVYVTILTASPTSDYDNVYVTILTASSTSDYDSAYVTLPIAFFYVTILTASPTSDYDNVYVTIFDCVINVRLRQRPRHNLACVNVVRSRHQVRHNFEYDITSTTSPVNCRSFSY